jgi:hypothetical protein
MISLFGFCYKHCSDTVTYLAGQASPGPTALLQSVTSYSRTKHIKILKKQTKHGFPEMLEP